MTANAEQLGSFDDAQLLAVAGPVRRMASARLHDRYAVDDVVQETMVRLLAARDRLDGSSLLPYALVTARNLIYEHGRRLERSRRHAHRVVDRREPERPEEVLLQHEEQAAIATAMEGLSDGDRRLLMAHEVDRVDTASLAAADGTTPGGVAAQLARARAKLRVEYVLALRREELPTVRCRPVLVALSSGDRRRQRSLEAGGHLMSCPTCAAASAPLLDRRRSLAGLAPWLWAPALFGLLRRRARQHPAQAATAAAVAAAVVAAVVAVVLNGPDTPAPRRAKTPAAARSPAPDRNPPTMLPGPSRLTVSGRRLTLGPGGSLAGYVGRGVRADRVLVVAVPADEGFWIATDSRNRVWVQLRTRGESGPVVRPGQRISFSGSIVATTPSFPAAAGVALSEGALQLRAQGAHIEAASSGVTIASG